MTRLQWHILRGLPLPFAAAFGTLMFLLLMQFLIKYLPDLVGRGLPVLVLTELVAYSLAYMVTLAVPMAWLIAQLAVFGRLAESRAWLVAKSAGVSLPRLAWPVLVVGMLLTVAMGVFNNEMLPEANYRMNGLWRDIRVARPGFALEPGQFYTGIDGYAIRADRIPPEDDGRLLGVTVFQRAADGGGEAVVTARTARLQTQLGGQRLTMLLEDGEVHRRQPRDERYERLAFSRYRLALDLPELGFERSRRGGSRSDRSTPTSAMLAQLDSLDALARSRADSAAAVALRLGRPRADAARFGSGDPDAAPTGTRAPTETLSPLPVAPSGGAAAAFARAAQAAADTLPPTLGLTRVALDSLDDVERRAVYDLATTRTRTVRSAVESEASALEWERQRAERTRVEIYKKNSIALACTVFVLIGIPLGLSIARVGVGMVASLAVGLFLFYWVTLVQGEKLADRGLLPAELGMWAANVLIGLLGLYLVIRETRDPAWRDPLRALAGRFQRRG